MEGARGAKLLGRLSIAWGILTIVAAPLSFHWVDPQIILMKYIILDLPLALLILVAGWKMLRGDPSGRSLAILYGVLAIGIETLGLLGVYLPNQDQLKEAGFENITIWVALGSLTARLLFPLVLLGFYLLPWSKRFGRHDRAALS